MKTWCRLGPNGLAVLGRGAPAEGAGEAAGVTGVGGEAAADVVGAVAWRLSCQRRRRPPKIRHATAAPVRRGPITPGGDDEVAGGGTEGEMEDIGGYGGAGGEGDGDGGGEGGGGGGGGGSEGGGWKADSLSRGTTAQSSRPTPLVATHTAYSPAALS